MSDDPRTVDYLNANHPPLPLTPAQRALLRRRSEAYRRNPAAAISLDEALARIGRMLDLMP